MQYALERHDGSIPPLPFSGAFAVSAASRPIKVLLVASVPSTLWAFYRKLPAAAAAREMEVAVAASPGRELGFFAKEHGIRTFEVPLPRVVSPLRDVQSLGRLARIVRRERFDIVHAFTSKAGLVAMSAGALAGVRCRVYSMLGLPIETATGVTRRMLAASERTACRLAHRVLAVSRSLRHAVVRLQLCPPEKIDVLADGTSCGVDLQRFNRRPEVVARAAEIRASLGIPAAATVVGFVGRLVYDKGIHTLVDSFVRLAERRGDAYLLLLGDYEPHRGEVPPHTVERIARHPRIRHVGFDWDPVAYYAAMDVLALPTLREGFPYAPLEAACLEVPTIGTRVTGCIDAVVDEETGLLVDAESADQLEHALERLVADPALRQRLGRAGRRRVEERFTDDRLLDAHLALYESMTRGGTA